MAGKHEQVIQSRSDLIRPTRAVSCLPPSSHLSPSVTNVEIIPLSLNSCLSRRFSLIILEINNNDEIETKDCLATDLTRKIT